IKEYQEKEKELQELKEKIIQEAKVEGEKIAQQIISESQSKAQEILEKAFQEGFQQGLSKAYQQVQQEYQQKIKELQEEINKVINIRTNLFKEMEKEFIEFVFLVAEKVINKKIQEEPNIVISYLKELLTKVERSKNLTIWVNPNELEEVRGHKQQLTYMLEDVENLNIIPDERIEVGGCIIETNFGKIDSRISTKLEVLKEIVLRGK
ncbi:MAG: FliH/SctL family protein, partial [bacterium]